MTVIYIGGKAQHGKDTTAAFLQSELEKKGKRTLIAHYGDFVKFVAEKWQGWDGRKDEHGRRLLQRVGTDVIRNRDPEFWVRFMRNMVYFFGNDYDYLLIPDCRFPNEIWWAPGVYIRVERPNFDNGLTPEAQAHESETALDYVDEDFRFVNDGSLSDLRDTCAKWVAQEVADK